MESLASGSPTDRWDLFSETASRRRLSPVIIEKDFWVCWTLRQVTSLESIGPNLIFKGGTSLSKAFGLIQRFSEDIDLSIQRSYLGFTGDNDPELAESKTKQRKSVDDLRKACTDRVQTVLLPALTERFKARLGLNAWSLTSDAEDKNTLNFVVTTQVAGAGRRGCP